MAVPPVVRAEPGLGRSGDSVPPSPQRKMPWAVGQRATAGFAAATVLCPPGKSAQETRVIWQEQGCQGGRSHPSSGRGADGEWHQGHPILVPSSCFIEEAHCCRRPGVPAPPFHLLHLCFSDLGPFLLCPFLPHGSPPPCASCALLIAPHPRSYTPSTYTHTYTPTPPTHTTHTYTTHTPTHPAHAHYTLHTHTPMHTTLHIHPTYMQCSVHNPKSWVPSTSKSRGRPMGTGQDSS